MNKLCTAIKAAYRAFSETICHGISTSNGYYELAEDEKDAFYEWAFGSEIQETYPLSRPHMKEWNKRHGKLLILKRDDSIPASLKIMVKLWRESLK